MKAERKDSHDEFEVEVEEEEEEHQLPKEVEPDDWTRVWKLLLEVVTRWSSTLRMVSRFVKMKNAIERSISRMPEMTSKEREKKEILLAKMPTSDEWTTLKEL